MASEGLHEPVESLDEATIDHHRAITSLMEEFEAVDWYDQRVKATTDPSLAAILAHNRDEEKEHAAMILEWLRRRDPKLDEMLRTYLFTDGPILDIERAAESRPSQSSGSGGGSGSGFGSGSGDGSLGLGGAREEER